MEENKSVEAVGSNSKTSEAEERNEAFYILGRNVSGLVHTFGNRLNTISGFAQHLLENAEKNGFSKKDAKVIYREMRKLENFVKDVLKFTSIKSRIKKEKGNINEFLREELSIIEAANKRKICFLIQLGKKLDEIPVSFDKEFLIYLVEDMIKNAADAKADTVIVKTEIDNNLGVFKIIVADNGDGIPDKNVNDIFTMFFTTKPGGTGIGLANAQAIALAHGGKIEVKKRNFEESEEYLWMFKTQFIISLPA